MDHFTRDRIMSLAQVLMILIISILLMVTRRDIGNLEADVQRLEKSSGDNRVHTGNTISSHTTKERPKDLKSLLARLEAKPVSLWDLLGRNSDKKLKIIFLKMSSDELVTSIWEINELDLPPETKSKLISEAAQVLKRYHPSVLVKNFWGKGIEFKAYADLSNAFELWLRDDPQAATAWYDQVGKATPISTEEMNDVELAVNRQFMGSPDELRKRLETLSPQVRYEMLRDLAWHGCSVEVALTLANEFGFSSGQISGVKDFLMRNLMYNSSQEQFMAMLDLVQPDTELLTETVADYVRANTSLGFRDVENNMEKLAQFYQWAESLAPGSGIEALQDVVGNLTQAVDSTDLDDAIERVLKLQSLITGVDLIKPLIDSLNEESIHDKAEALKARLNYREEVSGDEK